jgi:hypothetical protein
MHEQIRHSTLSKGTHLQRPTSCAFSSSSAAAHTVHASTPMPQDVHKKHRATEQEEVLHAQQGRKQSACQPIVTTVHEVDGPEQQACGRGVCVYLCV